MQWIYLKNQTEFGLWNIWIDIYPINGYCLKYGNHPLIFMFIYFKNKHVHVKTKLGIILIYVKQNECRFGCRNILFKWIPKSVFDKLAFKQNQFWYKNNIDNSDNNIEKCDRLYIDKDEDNDESIILNTSWDTLSTKWLNELETQKLLLKKRS